MKGYVVLSEKTWHDELFKTLSTEIEGQWTRIRSREDFSIANLERIMPEKIFIPHWSYMIPPSIYERFECVVFHMTDLPFGRGGSPLQNLIALGYEDTMLSALRVDNDIDAGDIYLKKPISLLGTAEEVFIRSSKVIGDMIKELLEFDLRPKKQEGKISNFKRRRKEDGNILLLNSIDEVFNYIRMLDCEGYPPAFIETDKFYFEFTRASLKADNSIIADVRITKR